MRVRRVVTTRAGGASRPPYESFNLGDHVGDDAGDVYANRKRLATELGLAEDKLAWMEQVHGRTATVVDGTETSAAEATDALVTDRPGVALVVLVADCVPVLMADPEAGVVAAVHAGRVGARVGVVPAALEAMRELGAEPGRVEALLGPAICGDCYEVPAAMAADVEKHLPGSSGTTRKGTTSLDLRAGLWQQLADLGVGRVGADPRCTAEDKTLFSFRRDGTTGRIAGITWLEEEQA
ncbi:peptidoglycan editing factor PgeF [Amycolatopsis rubida]|uniref:Purine nucleoside phosphorylase n=1 Tax=Amycolatopsis rubida TaxID=112413 RepID=A0ABX0C485_9PSEU|nr:peptidoglycan editing factor PgeF [Amycolatopsis sp. M39]MYW94828.1 peptidoglycan editing factor PgeF [Amycolatopsis rubida]NEC59815.1 peptidoglycan editing factor PgeF [Amycolatopsis rubida]OAP25222.1 Laccase domain protein YfiH [Amycolatopsis sp. M39]